MSAADPGPAWSAWSRVTPVAVAPAARERYVRVRIPLAISPGPDGSYADLRVVDAHGAEVPYALDPSRPRAAERAVPLIDTGYVARRGTQGVIDLGTSGALVDAVTLEVDHDRRPTFFERVTVSASDDRRTWRVVRDDAIIYRVAEDGGRGNSTLTFGATRSRWLRVEVRDPAAAFPLAGAQVVAGASHEEPLLAAPVVPVRSDDAAAHVQTFAFDARTPLRATAVRFADGGALYERPVTIEVSDDGKEWTAAGGGTISHYAEGGAQTTIPIAETTARYVRVNVQNGNDAPVATLRPALLVRPHALVFANGGGRYALVSGNRDAGAPAYDLGARLAHEAWRAAAASTEPAVANAGFRDVRPVGERFPWLITAALIAVAVVLGGLALRIVRPAEAS